MENNIDIVAMPFDQCDVARRRLLVGAGSAGIGLIATSSTLSTPRVAGVRLQFGTGDCSEVVIAWNSPRPVSWPRVLLGGADGHFHRTIGAVTVRYPDLDSGVGAYTHQAVLVGLLPATEYLYAAGHDGADPGFATFTASSVRSPGLSPTTALAPETAERRHRVLTR